MSATPVGDWIRRRYQDGAGTTHWMGKDADPGCSGGPHARCTYEAGYREGAADERERLRQLAIKANAGYYRYEGWGVPGARVTAGSYEPFADLIGGES